MKMNTWRVIGTVLLYSLTFASLRASPIVATPAQGERIPSVNLNSDEVAWNTLLQIAAPVPNLTTPRVQFETWATDADTFTANPKWPDPNAEMKIQSGLLGQVNGGQPPFLTSSCTPPQNAAAGGFPTEGKPVPCIAEQVGRNRPQFDYIVQNGLNTQAGIAAAFAKSAAVNMPVSAISMKGDWVPVQNLIAWIPELKSVSQVEENYYTVSSNGTEYALVAFHVATKQTPNWVWSTFEHQLNPGRCDTIGCYDSYAAVKKIVLPNKKSDNTQYGACTKRKEFSQKRSQANLSAVWENYCLKSSQISFVKKDGTPTLLGNSVIEKINANVPLTSTSCITCHGYAAFGANGQPTPAILAMLQTTPSGRLLSEPLIGSQSFDFMWGFLLAPP
jgi:hypothetical protein